MSLKKDAFTFKLEGKICDDPDVEPVAQTDKKNDQSGKVYFDPLKFAVYPTTADTADGYIDIAKLPMVDGYYEFKLTMSEDTTGLAEHNIRPEGATEHTVIV